MKCAFMVKVPQVYVKVAVEQINSRYGAWIKAVGRHPDGSSIVNAVMDEDERTN